MYNFKLHWHPCFKKTGSLMAATGNCSYSLSSHCAKVSELNSLQNVPLVKPSPKEKGASGAQLHSTVVLV